MATPFTITVKSIIRNTDGKVMFLIKERNGKKYLDLPGGRMDDNTFEQCIIRELKEELSLLDNVTIKHQVGEVWEFPSEIVKDGFRRLVVTFLVETELIGLHLSKEHEELLWIGPDDIYTIQEQGYILLKGFKDSLAELFSK